MRTSSLLAAAFVLVLASTARAEGAPIVPLRDGLRDLDTRARVVRSRAERAAPPLRAESERIVGVVDAERTFLETKLELYAMQGRTAVDEATAREIEGRRAAAERLLALVEGWYRAR